MLIQRELTYTVSPKVDGLESNKYESPKYALLFAWTISRMTIRRTIDGSFVQARINLFKHGNAFWTDHTSIELSDELFETLSLVQKEY